jgi:hypothetical protein
VSVSGAVCQMSQMSGGAWGGCGAWCSQVRAKSRLAGEIKSRETGHIYKEPLLWTFLGDWAHRCAFFYLRRVEPPWLLGPAPAAPLSSVPR